MSTIEDLKQVANWEPDSKMRFVPANDSLHGMLADRARCFADRRAYTFQGTQGDQTVTFAALDRRARAIGAALQGVVQPGDRVLLLFHAGLDFISSFFGCLYAGALAVPTTYPKPRRPMPRLTSIARDCSAVAALTDRETLSTIDKTITASELPRMRWVAVDEIEDCSASSLEPRQVAEGELAFLQYTSGSTSDPKGVMVSHANLLHNLEMIRRGFGLQGAKDGGDVQTGVFWLPAYHDMGLIGGILETMYVGGHSVLMSPAAFLQRPIGWLETMSDYAAEISGAPNFAYELCASRSMDGQRRRLDLSNWTVAFCGAEPIRPGTLQRFAEAFAVAGFREEAFYPCFGLAEGTLLAAGGVGPSELTVRHVRRDSLSEHRVEYVPINESKGEGTSQPLVGCGQALLGQEIRIVDPATQLPCAANEVGEIWLRGRSVAGGYWGRRKESERTFRARLANGDDGAFLRTGDLGFLCDGHLFVTGRVKDVIIIRGRNHYPQDIERTVGDAHEALRRDSGAVFTIGDASGAEQLVVVHEVDRHYRKADFDEIIRRVRRVVADVHDLEVHAVVLIRHASLPRTTSGKPQRHLCRAQWELGELRILADWKRETAAANGASDTHLAAKGPQRLEKSERPLNTDEVDRLAGQVESWLLGWLVERAAIPQEEVDRNKPFAEYGLDSLTSVELSQELEDWLGVEVVPTAAWNYPTPAALSAFLAHEVGGANGAPSSEPPADAAAIDSDFAQMLAEVESLTDEDVQALLKSESDHGSS